MKHSVPALLALFLCACVSNNPTGQVARPGGDDITAAASDTEQNSSRTAEPAPGSGGSGGDAGPTNLREASADVIDRDPVVARVAGEEVLAGELLAFWLHNRSEEVRDMIEHLVSAKLIGLEARRLGIEIGIDELDLGLLQSIQAIEEQIRQQDPTTSFREFVEVRLGLDSTRYKQQLRWEVERKMLGERVVRTFIMAQERIELKVIVVRTEAEIQAAVERLAGGEDFAVVAREISLDPSAGFGGRIPPILRNGTALSELAFATPVGEVGGPLQQEGRWLLMRTEERLAPAVGDWGIIGPKVELSLIDEPLADPEYWQWKNEMTERYKVDLEPFFELVSEPSL